MWVVLFACLDMVCYATHNHGNMSVYLKINQSEQLVSQSLHDHVKALNIYLQNLPQSVK